VNYKGTSGNDDFTGTSGHDVFNMAQGGSDTVDGGGGNDLFRFGAKFDSTDSIDGGTGIDTLVLDGDYSAEMFITAAQLTNVERINLSAGHSYSFAFFDGVIAHGASLTIDATSLGAADTAVIDGSYLSAASADTSLVVNGGAASTYFTGGAGANTFRGGSGNDYVYFGENFGKNDHLDGGGGNNTLQLIGDFSAGLTVTAAMMKNFEYLSFQNGYDYKITLSDANVAAGQQLEIYASNLDSSHSLNFNGTHETDGSFYFYDGAGNDILHGGQQHDFLSGENGGVDHLYGGGGDDVIGMGNQLTAADHIDGGEGNDEVDLYGDDSAGLTFKAGTVVNVETIFLNNGSSYKLVMNDGNVAAGQHMFLNGDLLSDTDVFYADASAETNGSYQIGGGAGDDTLIGGQAGNTLYGGFGQDKITAGLGADVFQYLDVGESTSVTRDIITGFDAAHDSFDLPASVTVAAMNTAVTSGFLSQAHFDGNLAAAIDAAHLGAGDAVLFTPDSGNLQGHTFLIVDANGVAGYQAGVDFVFELDSASHLGSLGSSNFG
jgi:Ca2+-binding RTX toxin-like protein